jgi:hypothetical protein
LVGVEVQIDTHSLESTPSPREPFERFRQSLVEKYEWNEAGAHAARSDPELRRFYRRKLVQKGLGKARVAVARKLGIRLWIMLRDQIDHQEFCRRGQKQSGAACAGMPEVGNGANRHLPVE